MKNWQIENSEKSGKSEISEKLFLVFREKSFRDFRGFRVFDLAICLVFLNLKMKVRNENYNSVNRKEITLKINKVTVL